MPSQNQSIRYEFDLDFHVQFLPHLAAQQINY
jgi:hypothetical protein